MNQINENELDDLMIDPFNDEEIMTDMSAPNQKSQNTNQNDYVTNSVNEISGYIGGMTY